MTRPLTLLITGDVADVCSLSGLLSGFVRLGLGFPGSSLSHTYTISRFNWFKGLAASIKILLLNLLFLFQHSLNFTWVVGHHWP